MANEDKSKRRIHRVAVLGSGVMGTGIAAHLAGAGLDVLLLDIPPSDSAAKGSATDRNQLSIQSLLKAKKSKPATFHDPKDAAAIAVGNLEDDLAKINTCDWVIEAVIEKLEIKQSLFARVETHRKAGALITSNTSGLSIEQMIEGRSNDFARNFFVTHFFNPVRYMRLLELVSGSKTDPQALLDMAEFGANVLGKGIVFGNDTPNFVANRIGTYSMFYLLHALERDGFSVEEIDTLFGQPMGRPKSAVFRTADIVGLDTLLHVANNCYETLIDDECREIFRSPQFLNEMVNRGWLGTKSGQGFYKKVGKAIHALNLETFEYAEKEKVRAESIGNVRKLPNAGERIKGLLAHNDRLAKLAWEATAHTLVYAANRLGEIADDIVNIDDALKWGFNWDLGPFEIWDAIGVEESVARMERDNIAVPEKIKAMLASGTTSFYGGSASAPMVYDFKTKGPQALAVDARAISLPALAEGNRVVEKNAGATLYDLGDGVLGLEFHTKMNAVDQDILTMIERGITLAESQRLSGLVVGNDNPQAFSAGANLFGLLVAASQKQWVEIESIIRALQGATSRMRSSTVPVVSAAAGLALGGGAEIAMAGDYLRAHAETYMGLVEVGVGLIPAGGGCWALLERFCGHLPDDPGLDALPFIRRAFTNIAMAKVSTGAEDARALGFLRHQDQVSFNRDHLLYDAKQVILGLARAGYRRPRPVSLRLPGASGAATFRWFVEDMRAGSQVTDHEAMIAGKLAWILCGGDTTPRQHISQQDVLDLEREAFLSLMGEAKTQARIQHMLEKGRPLRN